MSFSSTAALMSAAAPPLSASSSLSSPSSAAPQSSSQPCPCPSLEVLALLGADLRSILHPPSSSSPSPSSSSSAPSVFPRIGAREAWAVSAVLRAAYEAHPAGPPLGDKRATPLKNCKHCGQGPVSTLADTTAHTSSLAKHKGGGGGGGALRCCPDCKSWSHPTCDGWSLSPCERGKHGSGSVGDGGEKSSHTMMRDGVAAACDFDMAPRDSAMLRCRSCSQAQADAAAKSASRAASAKATAARLAANAAAANAVSTLVAAADQAAAAMATYSSSSSSSHYLFSPQLPSPSLPVSGAGATQSQPHHSQQQQQQQSFLGGDCSTNGSCFPPKHSQQTNGPSQLRAAPSLGHHLPPPPILHPHAPPTAQFYDQRRGQGQNVQQKWYYQEHQARSRQQPHHPHQPKQQQQQQGNSCLGRQRTDWPETGSSSSLTSESAAAEFTPSATTVGADTRRPASSPLGVSSASPDAGTKRRDGNCEDGNGNNHKGQKSGFVAQRVPFARAFTAGHGLAGHEDP